MRLAWFGSIVVAMFGCGGGGVSVDTSAENFCDEIAEVACNNFYQCCAEGEIEQILGVDEPRTEAQCREDVRRICDRNAVTLADSIEAGRVSFNPQLLNDCLNAIVAPEGTCASVEMMLPWKAACMETAFVGTVGTGAACFFSHDCAGAPDSFCGPDQKCAMKPTAGFPCGSGCASDYYCGPNALCQAKAAAGAPCSSSQQCQEGLFCDQQATPEPVCTAKAAGGSACTGNDGCVSESCVPGKCMGTSNNCYLDSQCSSRCADDNSFCTTAAQCGLGNCSVGGNSCSSDGNCTAGIGDVCVFPVQCLPGDCIGDPVCTAQQVAIDYCELTISAIPLF